VNEGGITIPAECLANVQTCKEVEGCYR
jgi:hypothetical protein